MLLCGLDGSGKTTLIKNYSQALEEFYAENKPKQKKEGDQAAAQGGQDKKVYNNEFAEFYQSTPFMNLEKITLMQNSMPCVVYDMSGQGRYRDSWQFFYPDVDGILFVVDASDTKRISIVADILEEMARHPCLRDRKIPFIILANKSDLRGKAIDENELRKYFNLDQLKSMTQMRYDVKNTSGITGANIGWCMNRFEEQSRF